MTSPSARLDRNPCEARSRAAGAEWLEPDGCGGFAMGTVSGAPARRYHGLLVATPAGHARRHHFLARWQEHLREPGAAALELSCMHRGGELEFDPRVTIDDFTIDPAPTWTLRAGEVVVEREVLVPRGRSVVLCRWSLRSAVGPRELELRPSLTCRELDRLHHRNDALDPRAPRRGDAVWCRPYSALPAVVLSVACTGRAWRWEESPHWVTGVDLPTEAARGYEHVEDHFVPGALVVTLAPGESVIVAASLDEPLAAPEEVRSTAIAARRSRSGSESVATRSAPIRARLAARADAYLWRDASGRPGVIAGYPWFGEWGRDTFLALPGLTLARGRRDECAAVLGGVLPFLRDGLLPNVFGPDPAASQYGSVDAALWFARAVDFWRHAGGAATGRGEPLDEALDAALLAIATRYHDGTALGIRADGDGLLLCGDERLNATWMDAELDGVPVTPRHGKPVEIEALWCALLDQLVERGAGSPWTDRRDRAWGSFAARFFVERPQDGRGATLADRIAPDGTLDLRVRPNMVLAAALARSPLSARARAAVLDRSERELLTPRGLRSLSPHDPEYRGRYGGDVVARDLSYHQGTVWPFLLGSHVELALRVRGGRAAPGLRALLDGFQDALGEAGLGHVAEVYDGDPPHRPGGTIAQAWSCGELLRACTLLEELA